MVIVPLQIYSNTIITKYNERIVLKYQGFTFKGKDIRGQVDDSVGGVIVHM